MTPFSKAQWAYHQIFKNCPMLKVIRNSAKENTPSCKKTSNHLSSPTLKLADPCIPKGSKNSRQSRQIEPTTPSSLWTQISWNLKKFYLKGQFRWKLNISLQKIISHRKEQRCWLCPSLSTMERISFKDQSLEDYSWQIIKRPSVSVLSDALTL